ncbi:hypothetical protein SCANM63S_06620 [Streptomyces canarius]
MRYSSRIGRPAKKSSRISRVPAAYRAWAERVEPDTCGVMALCGMVRQGWLGAGGCGYQTSPAYPASRPDFSARTTASRTMISARAVLTM